ncbi:MAG: thioesterase family protein [Hyphomicrobium sp.]|uniref:thioesterase family protein n=1 Tax=Hyphomicrobium sp. TaxID=82 RepID=UPI003D1384C6
MSALAPFPLAEVAVKPQWVDYNGHMNDAAYAEAFSEALMTLTDHLGLDADGRAESGHTIYTVSMMIHYLQEATVDTPLTLSARVLESDAKRLRVWAEMHNAATGDLLATTEQLFLCVDQSGESPRAASWPEPFAARVAALAAEHATLPVPEKAGEGIRLKRKPS